MIIRAWMMGVFVTSYFIVELDGRAESKSLITVSSALLKEMKIQAVQQHRTRKISQQRSPYMCCVVYIYRQLWGQKCICLNTG